MALSADTHFALPNPTSHLTDVVLGGVGMRRTTFVPVSLGSKLALRLTVYSTRDLPTSSTIGWTLKGRLTFDVERYLGWEAVIDQMRSRSCFWALTPRRTS